MLLNFLKYLILFLVLCNIASIMIVGYGSATYGALLSAMTYGGLLLYYFLSSKNNPAWPFVLFAIVYYTISGAIDVPVEKFYFRDFIKYLIMIVCGGELARRTTLTELMFFLGIGSSSILIHSIFFESKIGRFSGFYLDPNSASFICLLGCCMTYAIKSIKWRLIILFFYTFCGALTFSRSFFVLWFLMSIMASIQNRKNLNSIGLGIASLFLLLSLSVVLEVNTSRLSLIEGALNNDFDSHAANEDSRTETWSLYYDKVFEAPFFGNGYRSFSGKTGVIVGVHNTYLRIIGEAGIIALLLYLYFYGLLLFKSVKVFWTEVHKPLLVVSIMILLLTIHNFVIDDYITLISLWLYFNLRGEKVEEENYEIDDGIANTI